MTEPRNRREADVDYAIDRVVRELTDGEPSRGFEQVVLDRIHQTRGHGVPWMRLGFGGAAFAAVVMAIVLTRTPAPTQGPVVTLGPSVASTVEPKPIETPAPTAAPAVEPRVVRRIDATRPRRTLTAASTRESEAVITPLQSLEPIAVAPLEPESIEPAPIAIAPLAPIRDVQVAVLSPSVGRE